MTPGASTEAAFTPASLGAVVPQSRKANPIPVRIAFQPFGRRRVGDPDPDAPGYQILDGWMVYAQRPAERPHIAHFRDVSGRSFAVIPGGAFRATVSVPDGFEDEFSLSEYRSVLGRRHTDGRGYIPVGIHPVFMQP